MAIRVLPQNLINQIAAGEVVVNMASVAKELVENAIDAGATHITVEIANEVRDLVVVDDGCGMNREDAELCLQRHATSKIGKPDDLFDLRTRGFRGEAIPSIASVSRLEIQSRPAGALAGTRVLVEGGAIERIESAGCPIGTRLAVRDLFFNTPARRKFLKSTVSETNALMHTLVRQALAVPAIGFRVVRDGRAELELPAGQSLADRFLAIAGSRIDSELLELSFERDGVRVSGFLAQPQSSRGDRRSQYLFVNRRPFASKPLASAVEQACRGFIMTGRFPIFCVFVDVPAGEVDINVHPSKEEVRFRNERLVAGTCYHAARLALEAHGHVPEMKLGTEEAPAATPPQPPGFFAPSTATNPIDLVNRAFARKKTPGAQADLLVEAARRAPAPQFVPAAPTAPQASAPPAHASRPRVVEAPIASPGERPEPQFWNQPYEPEPLGQIAETYILVRFGGDLLIVDQHAAHERIRYLQLRERASEAAPQALLVPMTMEIAPDRTAALEALLPALREMGFTIEPFGGRTWAVTSVPSDLKESNAVGVITDLLDEFDEQPRVDRLEDLRQRILVRMACHTSIRAGRRLSREEMVELLNLMQRYQLSFTCPHGRPTVVRLSRGELDRQFKRE